MTGKICSWIALFLTILSGVMFVSGIGGDNSLKILFVAVLLLCIGVIRGEGG